MAAGDVTIGGHSGRTVRGTKLVWGTVVLDGSGATPVDLSAHLSAIQGFQLTLEGSSAPGDDVCVVTGAISTTTLNVYPWEFTSGSDPTLVASDNNSAVVHFLAIGTA